MTAGATPCGMTVVGGFLGAGKTTFLNQVLSGAQGRYAVLVNDFGSVNVDAGLIADHDGETLRLTNGCVCCSLGDSFLDTLIRVLDQQPAFDHIVVEASGVADPRAIAEIALIEPGLQLNAVVVLVDAERIAHLLQDERVADTVAAQVRAADIVLLNKVDLVDADGLAKSRAALGVVRQGVRIVATVAARCPDALLGLAGRAAPAPSLPGRVRHEDVFERLSYQRDEAFDPDRFPAVLDRLPASLLRLKGRCTVSGQPPLLLQMVGPRWSLTAAPAGLAAGRFIELVGIGAGAGLQSIGFILDDALAQDGPYRRP